MGIVAKPDHDKTMQYVMGPGPKGIIDELIDNYIPVWTSDIGQAKGVVSARMQHNDEQPTPLLPTISIWLPCGISVKRFPQPEHTDFEFYVPVDEKRHLYFQTISKICSTPQEAASLREEVDTKWIQWAFEEFNGDDVGAREGLEDGDTSGDGWAQETLTRNDIAAIAWRQFASQYNRAGRKQRKAGY